MKFIHTSDWHLGRQLHNVSLLEDQQHVLTQLIAYATQEAVDAVVIAGDIYDRSVPPAAAVELLDATLNTLCAELHIPVIMIPGNHDGAERLRFGARQLRQSGLHILGALAQITEPVHIRSSSMAVAFWGMPYNDPETVRHHFGVEVSSFDEAHSYLLALIAAQKSPDVCNVLLSHCFLDGAETSESERPLAIGGADRVSYTPFSAFDYVALGHLHSPQYRGLQHIRYSGSILKYSFSEHQQQKGVTLVEMQPTGLKATRQLPLTPLRDMRILEGELEALLAQGKTDPNADDYLLVRLSDKHALLDPMAKLRQVYPNVLHLEKPGMLGSGEQQASRALLKRGELEMFRDFYQQVAGNPLSAEQDAAITRLIQDLQHSEAAR